MLVATITGAHQGLLANTNWRVMLNIESEAPKSGFLPLPLNLRFAGDSIAQVDDLLRAPKRLETLTDSALIVTQTGEHSVPVSAIGWTEDPVCRERSLVHWCVNLPEGAARGAVQLPPGRVYCSVRLWQAADLDTKRRALTQLQQSMSNLEGAIIEWCGDGGSLSLFRQLTERRRLDERILALEEAVPDTDVLAVPGTTETVVAREGDLSMRRERAGMAARLASLLGGASAEYVQIGTFSLRPMPSPPPPRRAPRPAMGAAHRAVAATAPPRACPSRMGFLALLPGFSKGEVPEGYARASHVLFLGTDSEIEKRADTVLERIRAGSLTFPEAARQYSNCPTRDQEPPGDLGTFAVASTEYTHL